MIRKKQPTLVLIGMSSVVAMSMLTGCDDSPSELPAENTVDVLRTHYDSLTECQQVWWISTNDCTFIPDPVTSADPATVASGANSTSSAHAGGWSGGSSGNRQMTSESLSGQSGVSDFAAAADHAHGHWYGPYYTRSGIIYHHIGGNSYGSVPSSDANTDSLTVRESSLGSGSVIESEAPSAVAKSESAAISRGGFVSGSSEGGSHFFSSHSSGG